MGKNNSVSFLFHEIWSSKEFLMEFGNTSRIHERFFENEVIYISDKYSSIVTRIRIKIRSLDVGERVRYVNVLSSHTHSIKTTNSLLCTVVRVSIYFQRA